MIDRVTFHVRDGIAVTGVGKIYDPAKRKTRTMAGAVIRLAEYEDTGLDPCEIVKLKAERDAAVRDIEEILALPETPRWHITGEGCLCDYCEKCDDCNAPCRPKWRGPQQEET